MTSDDVVGHDLTVDDDWRENRFFRRRPSLETFAWVAASMGEGSRVTGHRRLTGGVNSAIHRLTIERHGRRTFVVLRQYPAGSVELRTALEEEIAISQVVAGSGLPVPTILTADVAGKTVLAGSMTPEMDFTRGAALAAWERLAGSGVALVSDAAQAITRIEGMVSR